MFEYINKCMPEQKPEVFLGNREYKIYLDNETIEQMKIKKNKSKEFRDNFKIIKNINKLNKRASQLRFRLEEGKGKALYMIGITDKGNNDGIDIETLFKSINYLYKMVEIINADIKSLKIYKGKCEGKFICSSRIDIPNYIEKKLPRLE
jgi:GTPase|tara:strand:+ start:160 stop:606 length:447 start_codon:yes stop_codon:yes gene_type:complete